VPKLDVPGVLLAATVSGMTAAGSPTLIGALALVEGGVGGVCGDTISGKGIRPLCAMCRGTRLMLSGAEGRWWPVLVLTLLGRM
jgi:hypothetical protein